MSLSWKIGTAFGIPIRLHFSMLLVPLLTYQLMPVNGLADLVAWFSVVVLLFGSVLLHEFGHALTARRFGIRTLDIVLTPLGGMARIVNMPTNPRHEIAIAIAGPAVSLCLAGLSFLAFVFLQVFFPPVLLIDRLLRGLDLVAYINLGLGLFNLIPALPMDGGRVLRGYLALKRDFLTATRIAAKVGRSIAIIGGLLAVFWLGNVVLAAIAVFIYLAAGAEVRMAEMREFRRQAASGAYGEPGPFSAPPGSGPRVWSWTWRGRGPGPDPWSRPSKPRHEDWSRPDPNQERDVIVIDRGKVQIISRKDPDEE